MGVMRSNSKIKNLDWMAVITADVALFWSVFLFSLSSYCVSPDVLISYYFGRNE